jgi:membrane fusion protein (multidrug efflux system)
MKKFAKSLIILLSLFLITCQQNEKNNVEKAIPVKVFAVHPDSLSTYLEISGNLEAQNDALIYSQVSEELKRIHKRVGTYVQKGEIIAELENQIWKETLNQAQASLNSITARHAQVKSDYERYKRLYEERAISQQQWEKIRSSMQETDATLAQLNAAYQQAHEQYLKTYIKAPFDGIVGSLYFDVGQMIAAGQPVAKIVNTDLMKARLNIPDIHINKLHLGQNVVAAFPALPGKQFTGIINQADPAIDQMSRTVEVEVMFQNRNNELISGLFGLFKLELIRKENVLVIPEHAIIRRTQLEINRDTGETSTQQQYFVFVVQKDTAQQVEVIPGLESEQRMEIVSGLNSGDQVIILGQKIVKDGRWVTIIEE